MNLWRGHRSERRHRRPGAAMLLAAAMSAALATAATDLVSASRATAIEAAHLERAAALRLAADGALNRAAAALAAALESAAPPDDGRWSLTVGGVDVQTSAVESTGLLPLNQIGPDGLDAALAAIGAPLARLSALRDAILDWRDPDDRPRRLGAETDLYQLEGRPPPGNRPFQHISELAVVRSPSSAVLGHEPQADAQLRRARDALANIATVWSDAPGVNLRAAPASVLAALPNLPTPLMRQALSSRIRLTAGPPSMERRDAVVALSATELAALAPPTVRRALTTRRSKLWVMTAIAADSAGARTTLRRVLRIADARTPGGKFWWIDQASLIDTGLEFRGAPAPDEQERR